jgi:hypothetical protein
LRRQGCWNKSINKRRGTMIKGLSLQLNEAGKIKIGKNYYEEKI